jgi:hypothetical protein
VFLIIFIVDAVLKSKFRSKFYKCDPVSWCLLNPLNFRVSFVDVSLPIFYHGIRVTLLVVWLNRAYNCALLGSRNRPIGAKRVRPQEHHNGAQCSNHFLNVSISDTGLGISYSDIAFGFYLCTPTV